MRVELIFTDAEGRRWRVYDWNVISGHRYKRSPGEQCAEYRGFLDEATGERRVYQFPTEGRASTLQYPPSESAAHRGACHRASPY
jgi:hypothetical protein